MHVSFQLCPSGKGMGQLDRWNLTNTIGNRKRRSLCRLYKHFSCISVALFFPITRLCGACQPGFHGSASPLEERVLAARVQMHCIKATEVFLRLVPPSAALFLQGSFCDEECTRACLFRSPVEALPAFGAPKSTGAWSLTPCEGLTAQLHALIQAICRTSSQRFMAHKSV